MATESYQLIFENHPYPLWVYDLATLRFLAVNQTAIDHYGYSRDEFLQMTPRDLRPSTQAGSPDDILAESETGDSTTVTSRHQKKDGSKIIVEITSSQQLEWDGRKTGLLLALDITKRQNAERTLLASERRYREIFENAVFGMYRARPGGEILDVNPALVAMLGYDSQSEFLQLNLRNDVFLDPLQCDEWIELLKENKPSQSFETVFKHKNTKGIVVCLSGRPIMDTQGAMDRVEIIVEDVTERKQVEVRRHQSDRLEALGRLTGGIAHDFNNLMGIVIGQSEILLDETDLPDASRKRLQSIKDSGIRAATLTRQLMVFGRHQGLEPRILDLNVLVTGVCDLFRRLLGPDIELEILAAPSLGKINADPGQIEQVVMNLALNARDAMPTGGKLTIETSNIEFDRFLARRYPQVTPGPYVEVAVRDTGIGMDRETQARIFEPFFTTKEKIKGTGLGLATVYGIVKEGGGFIWVTSELGQGTTFKFYLPRVIAPEVGAPAAEVPGEPLRGTETILFAEDEEALRTVTVEFLRSGGYKVLEACNCPAALATARVHQGPLDLLLTDMVLPEMSGTLLAKQLTEMRPNIKVLYVSGYSDQRVNPSRVPRSKMQFLQKPFTRRDLLCKVREVLDTGDCKKEVAADSILRPG